MIDLHSHLLPGVDDGSRSFDNSLRVLERFAAEGVTVVACTPHLRASEAQHAPVAAHAALRAELQAMAPAGLQLEGGFEIMLDRPGCALDGAGLSLGGSRAVLVELPRMAAHPDAGSELLRLRGSGVIPVLAHPERYRGATVEMVAHWRACGSVIQGDAFTLLSSGPMAQLARMLLDHGLYDILASDNHGDRRSLSVTRLWLRELGRDREGELLTEENPRRLLAGEPLVPVPPLRPEGRAGGRWWEKVRGMFTRA